MSIVEYNFQEFTEKDMFELKLKDAIPDFGYISCTKRKPFFDFCILHGFFGTRPEIFNDKLRLYSVQIDFRFAGMLDYRPKPIIFLAGGIACVQSSFKMHNLKSDSA